MKHWLDGASNVCGCISSFQADRLEEMKKVQSLNSSNG